MSKRVHWSEEQLERRLSIARKVGQAVQAADDAKHLMVLAQQMFANGNDQQAELLRDLSRDLTEVSKERRKEQAELEAVYERDWPHGDVDPELENG